MNREKLKLLIFSLIGIFNTLFDIALYVVFLNLTHSFVVANIISTTAALIGSYFLNAKLTFKATKWTFSKFAAFMAVTVFGLWVLQTTAIYGITKLLVHIPEHDWQKLGGLEHLSKSVVPKLLATGITFIWNYIWYSRVIFKSDTQQMNAVEALNEL